MAWAGSQFQRDERRFIVGLVGWGVVFGSFGGAVGGCGVLFEEVSEACLEVFSTRVGYSAVEADGVSALGLLSYRGRDYYSFADEHYECAFNRTKDSWFNKSDLC